MFFSKRASLENPRTPIDNNTLDYIFNGPPTASGVQVSEQSALRSSAVWACIRILAESVSSLPFHVYEINSDGSKGRVRSDRRVDLLERTPNSDTTPAVWKETLQAHLGGWGNAYSYVIRDMAGRPRELIPLLPDSTSVRRDVDSGKLVYQSTIDGTTYRMRPQDVIHVPGLGYDGLVGYSPIAMHRQSIGLAISAEEYGARFFAGDATVSGVIELPAKLADTTSLEESWKRAHSGIKNAHRIAVLEQGAKYQKIGIPPGDAQFIETRKFQINDIARIYRIPPHMIADLEHATFTNIEHQSLEFVKYTLMPWLVKWEQELTRKLFTGPEQRRFYVKINVEGLLRGDQATRYAAYREARETGWMNINEIREKEDLNGIGSDGDEYLLIPTGYTDVNNDSDSDSDNDNDNDSDNDSRSNNDRMALLEQKLAERVLAREINSVKKEYKKGGFDQVGVWYEENKNKVAEFISDSFNVDKELGLRYLNLSLQEFGDSETVEEWAESRASSLLCAVNLAEKLQ